MPGHATPATRPKSPRQKRGWDLVGDGLGWSNFAKNGHGTFVAGMISANVNFGFSTTSSFLAFLDRDIVLVTRAGIAAVLLQAVPQATARQVRNALIMAADVSALGDGSGPFDMGNG